jgi:Ca2+-binding EF-hand superfamily protein
VDRTGFRIVTPAAPADLDTQVVAAVRPDILDTFKGREMVRRFYRMIPALSAIDANHDLVLSMDEIDNAPQVLPSLDRNQDGVLEVSECGWPRFRTVYEQLPGEEDVMKSNPVLAALDVDRDGRISAKEIKYSASTLKLLDRDHNGRLTPDEVLSAGQRKLMEEFLNDARP